jgi:uncharacterized protein YhdP
MGCGRYNNARTFKDCRIKALPRICVRLLAAAAAFLLVLFTALVLWLRYVALPDVDRWRPDLLHSVERSTGMSVGVTNMRGGWGGLRPVLSLEGVSINDKAGRAAFKMERVEVTLSWWSLFAGKVRFYDLDFYRPDLVLRRGADGLIYLADKPINTAGPGGEGAFTEWLLAQPRLAITTPRSPGATTTWARPKSGWAPWRSRSSASAGTTWRHSPRRPRASSPPASTCAPTSPSSARARSGARAARRMRKP